jgi:hypothetical protein
MAPDETSARVLKSLSFKLLLAVADLPSSKLIERPLVLPPILIVPDDSSVIYNPPILP